MRAKTPDGREIDLKQDTLAGLKMRLQGPLFAPGDAGYDESRTVWNAMIDRKPVLVARCLGISDVIACVQFARENEILLCIKGGGHNIAGLATADGALMLDMSLMRGVWVDPEKKVAHAQAGCLLGDVDRETQEGPERTRAALGKGLQRLAEVKAKWDPRNVFRTNRNIKPV